MKIYTLVLFILVLAKEGVRASDDLYFDLPKMPINQRFPLIDGSALFAESGPVLIAKSELPALFSPETPRFSYAKYPWKSNIVTTVFWVGEKPTLNNPVPNTASSWDPLWTQNFGGYDDPEPSAREGYLPKNFVPKQNPFYIALPYNDVIGMQTKDSARKSVPWFHNSFYRDGQSVLKGRWMAIRQGDKVCFGQWEDCGPFGTDDSKYVFGNDAPATKGNGGAGLDVSPAVRDYLGFRYSTKCDWRFVDLHEVHDGPWKKWGNNNPFVLRSSSAKASVADISESIAKLHNLKKLWKISTRN